MNMITATAFINDVPTWVWTILLLSLTWGYLGMQSRRKAAARGDTSFKGSSEGVRTTDANCESTGGVGIASSASTSNQSTIISSTAVNSSKAPGNTAVASVEADAAEPFEPEPPSDPVMKARMKELIAGLDEEWAASGPPLLDNGAMRVWHRPVGGSVHSFKYEVVMPLGPGKRSKRKTVFSSFSRSLFACHNMYGEREISDW